MQTLTLDELKEYLTEPQPLYLPFEDAIAYLLNELLKGDIYGYEVCQRLAGYWGGQFRLSETVYWTASRWLEEQGFVTVYEQKTQRKGRPRRMLKLNQSAKGVALPIVNAWLNKLYNTYKVTA